MSKSTVDPADVVEISLEDAGGKSWISSIAFTLASQFGNAYYRFVSVPPNSGTDNGTPGDRIESETFPVSRGFGTNPGSATLLGTEMNTALQRLRDELASQGWVPAGRGEHAWSYRYTRPHRTAATSDS